MEFIVVNNVRHAYQLDGPADAPLLILINSLGTNLHLWDEQVAAFTRNFRLLRYDLRGHGATDVSPVPYALADLGSDLLSILDHLHIVQAHICGISLGGMVALWLAAHHPERIQRAVFANTAMRIGTAQSWDERIRAVRMGGMEQIRDAVLARFLSLQYRQAHPDGVREIAAMLMAIDPAGYCAACSALRDADLHEQVSMVRVPALILAGALDQSTPPVQAHELHAYLADSQLHVFSGIAHLSNKECPQEFNERVVNFLLHTPL